MVQALLAGRKTQTRRVLNPQPPDGSRYSGVHYASYEPSSHFFNTGDGGFKVRQRYEEGDALWVRENWGMYAGQGIIVCESDRPNAARKEGGFAKVTFRAGTENQAWGMYGPPKWRPSIHMPRTASRLTLIVADVRVQRLQEITASDAQSEGVEWESADPPFYYVPGIMPHSLTAVGVEEPGALPHAVRSFGKLWDYVNGTGAWDRNPWVVALTFTVHRKNIDLLEAA
jgi:hypothetical protein